MITVTNNATHFFEHDNSAIVIYSAGNSGYWTGYYMNRVGIDFLYYIDRDVKREGSVLNGHCIYRPDKLKDFKGKTIRIIVCPICYKEICSDLLWLDKQYGFNALLMVPQYKDFIHREERYNINKFLGYFRRKLIIGESPTIISNDCSAGFIYEALNMIALSPTINTGISAEDFLKICTNPKNYLSRDIEDLEWRRLNSLVSGMVDVPVGRLGDISVIFGHDKELERIPQKWRVFCENINWDRIMFLMQDDHYMIPLDAVKKFDSLKEEHLFVSMRTQYAISSDNIVYFKNNWLHHRNIVIENNFDLLGWINKEL